MEGRLVGWGYQGRTPEDLVAAMSNRGATRLVDVRLTPVSRVRGFSSFYNLYGSILGRWQAKSN